MTEDFIGKANFYGKYCTYVLNVYTNVLYEAFFINKS